MSDMYEIPLFRLGSISSRVLDLMRLISISVSSVSGGEEEILDALPG